MGRGNDQAQAASKSANQFSGALQGQAGSLYGSLAPGLMAQATHPQGMSPEDMASANTSVQQSAGGGEAAAVGQGALNAARTKNAGTSDAAVASAARTSGQNLSKGALATQLENADLKQKQQSGAQRELGGLYGTSVGGGNQALGEVANNVNANSNAEEQSWNWAKFILDPALKGAGEAAGAGAFGCWIAEAIYGVDDVRTHLVRAWLNGPFMGHWYGRAVMAFYFRYGQRIAAVARRSAFLRAALKPLFDQALGKSCRLESFVAW